MSQQTLASLRRMMEDDRYWNAQHPDYVAYNKQVKDGFDALYGNDPVDHDETGRMIQPKPKTASNTTPGLPDPFAKTALASADPARLTQEAKPDLISNSGNKLPTKMAQNFPKVERTSPLPTNQQTNPTHVIPPDLWGQKAPVLSTFEYPATKTMGSPENAPPSPSVADFIQRDSGDPEGDQRQADDFDTIQRHVEKHGRWDEDNATPEEKAARDRFDRHSDNPLVNALINFFKGVSGFLPRKDLQGPGIPGGTRG